MSISEKELTCFAACLRAGEKSAATIEKYLREAARFAAWLGGNDLSRESARAYKDELAAERAPAGVNGAVAALNSLFDFLEAPGCRLKSLRIQRKIFRDEARELTQNEYRRLLTAAKYEKNERLLLVMEAICATGIRVSELKFFTVEAVRQGLADVTNKGKTRTVFFPGKLWKALLRYARARRIVSGPVFVTRNGKPLNRSNIWREKDIVRLADILGHSSINTTRIYTMESGETHRRQLEKMRLVL